MQIHATPLDPTQQRHRARVQGPGPRGQQQSLDVWTQAGHANIQVTIPYLIKAAPIRQLQSP